MKHDVTAGFDEALYKILKGSYIHRHSYWYMPLVYICSPFSGDEETNMAKARVYSRFAYLMGYIPFCPHIYFPQFCYEETEREHVVHMNNVFLGKCSEVWVFGEKISAGMQAEIEKARTKDKVKVRYFTEGLEEKEQEDETDD